MEFAKNERRVLSIGVLFVAALVLFGPTSGLLSGIMDYEIYGILTPRNILAILVATVAVWVKLGNVI